MVPYILQPHTCAPIPPQSSGETEECRIEPFRNREKLMLSLFLEPYHEETPYFETVVLLLQRSLRTLSVYGLCLTSGFDRVTMCSSQRCRGLKTPMIDCDELPGAFFDHAFAVTAGMYPSETRCIHHLHHD